MNYNFKFKADNPIVNNRKNDCQRIKDEYPNKVPIICENDTTKNLPMIDKTKFLVPDDLLVSQFASMIRQRINIDSTKAIYFLFAGQYTVSMDTLMGEVYERYKDEEDGFLYVVFSTEESWG
jgi:hypothetical protein